ncbi:unnamed protein product [Adineta steineri]|uniref:G domain-containing protein n=1 Tax=Adineta steineri TaxID=433720 RepID=A0A814AVK9_9BILA|nr:unnamed protein product [Adineta steineri]CAF0919061.1 unnamed protein product [Adineta steineri]
MGLEGSGKTSLINNLCGTSYPAGTNRYGYRIGDDQRGSFRTISPACEITLYDTNGLKINEPGKWHEHLKSTLEINGVIFFIDGHDKRCSLHGDLPRLIEYCRNLELPILYLFRSDVVDWFDEECTPDNLVNAKKVEKKDHGNDIAYYSQKDKNRLKQVIADRFALATTAKALIDPVQLATKIREMENRHEQEIKKLKDEHQQIINEKESFYNNLEQLYENNKKHLEHLKQNLTETQKLYEELKNKNETLSTTKRRLQQEIDELKRKKHNSLQTIKRTMNYLRINVNEVAMPNIRDDGKLRVRSKKHKCKKHKAWLPFMGVGISNDYDILSERIAELLNGIVSKLEDVDDT